MRQANSVAQFGSSPKTLLSIGRKIANAVEPNQDGRIHIEKIKAPTPAEFIAGLDLAVERGWFVLTKAALTSRYSLAASRRVSCK